MRTPEENYEAAALELAAYRLMQREQDDIDTPMMRRRRVCREC